MTFHRIVPRHHWQTSQARCRHLAGTPAQRTSIMFPADRQAVTKARNVCAGCPLRLPCATVGLEGGEHGMWGGWHLPDEHDQAQRWLTTKQAG